MKDFIRLDERDPKSVAKELVALKAKSQDRLNKLLEKGFPKHSNIERLEYVRLLQNIENIDFVLDDIKKGRLQ